MFARWMIVLVEPGMVQFVFLGKSPGVQLMERTGPEMICPRSYRGRDIVLVKPGQISFNLLSKISKVRIN